MTPTRGRPMCTAREYTTSPMDATPVLSEHDDMRSTSREGPRSDDVRSEPGATVDEMSECSFPASDPPAVWTWEVRPAVPDEDPPAPA
jgi:hypothetical protein